MTPALFRSGGRNIRVPRGVRIATARTAHYSRHVRALTGTVVLAVAVTVASPSEAHLGLHVPPSRYGDAVLKVGPCGAPNGQRSDNVTELEPGASIEVVWDEYVNHPGHFRISFDADGDDDFVDPACLSGCNTRNPEIEMYSNDTVLLDGIADTPSGGESSVRVTLPDIECDNCTLQVIQVMYDKPPYTTPGNDIYYQCADLVLRRTVEPPDSGSELPCIGDCDASGVVTVDELLTGVDVVLGQSPLTRCERLQRASVDALVVAVGNALHGCSNARAREFPDFERFDFLRGPAFGFCPTYDSVLASTLLREEDGRYTLKTTVAERGIEGVDRCLIPGRFGGDCTLGRVRGCRTLSEEESVLVHDALATIRVWPEAAPDCGVIDPCLNVSLDWDDVRLTDDPCGNDRPLAAEIERIAALLDSLTSDSMGECPAGFCQIGDIFLCNDGNDVGGDGCAANCTDERPVSCEFVAPSELTLQTQDLPFRFPLAGQQTLRLGAQSRFDSAVPVAVRSDEFHPQPMSLAGLGCLCLHGDALPPLGDGLTGVGFVGCFPSFLSTNPLAVSDRDTTPGSAGNAGGLPDDPECDDSVEVSPGVFSHACREGVDPGCGTEVTGRCRSPNVVTLTTSKGGSGSAIVGYNLRLGFLSDGGLCSTEGPGEGGSCPFPDYGPDCLPCTDDDGDDAQATLVFATTGTADSALFDAGPVSMVSDIEREQNCGAVPCQTTAEGERFDCTLLTTDPARGWGTGTLAGAWPEVQTPELGDSVATLLLRCE